MVFSAQSLHQRGMHNLTSVDITLQINNMKPKHLSIVIFVSHIVCNNKFNCVVFVIIFVVITIHSLKNILLKTDYGRRYSNIFTFNGLFTMGILYRYAFGYI